MRRKNNYRFLVVYAVVLALLVNAGQFKAHPALSWFPIDLTLFFAALGLLFVPFARAALGPASNGIYFIALLWVAFLPPIAFVVFDSFSIRKITLLFTVTLILAISPFYGLRTHRQRRAFLFGIVIIAGFFVIGTFTQSENAIGLGRATVESANTIGTARVAMAGAIVLAFQAFNNSISRSLRLLSVLAVIATSFLGVMTGSRGPVFASIFAILLVVAFAPVFKKYKVRAFFGVMVLSGVAYWLAKQSDSDGLARIVAGSETSDGARFLMWEQSLGLIANHPFGIGWGMYDPPGSDSHGYPHNFLLEIGVESGWIPLLIISVLLMSTLIKGVVRSQNIQNATFFGLYVFALINAMVSGDINGNRLLWLTLLAIWILPNCQEGIETPVLVKPKEYVGRK